MMTPPPKARSGPSTKTYTIEEKQQLLDNFDLEGESLFPNQSHCITIDVAAYGEAC